MDGIKYPIRIQDINKFERLNNISVNVFAINEDEKIFPLRITPSKDLNHHVNLLYITDEDGERSHYTLISPDLSVLKSTTITRKSLYVIFAYMPVNQKKY